MSHINLECSIGKFLKLHTQVGTISFLASGLGDLEWDLEYDLDCPLPLGEGDPLLIGE